MAEEVLRDMDLLVTSKQKLAFVISIESELFALRFSTNRRRRPCLFARRPFSGVQLHRLSERNRMMATVYRLPQLRPVQKSLMKSIAARLLGTMTRKPAEHMLVGIGMSAEGLNPKDCELVGNLGGGRRRSAIGPSPSPLTAFEVRECQAAFNAALQRPFNVALQQRC